VVYGGSTAGLKDLETGYPGFKNVIEASREFDSNSPGVPLIYKFRHLADNNLALVTLTSQYTLVKPIRLQQTVKVTVVEFVCKMADDEGADNTVEMDRFAVSASAYNRVRDSESGSPIIENTKVFYWETSGEKGMDSYDTFPATGQNSLFITFDTEFYNFDLARLVLVGYARDWDGNPDLNSPEEGLGKTEILGRQFLDNGGQHTFLIDSRDFQFEAHIKIELVD